MEFLIIALPFVYIAAAFLRLHLFKRSFDKVFFLEDGVTVDLDNPLDIHASFDNITFWNFWRWDFDNMLVYEKK